MRNYLWKQLYAVAAMVSLMAASTFTLAACSDDDDVENLGGVTGLTVPQKLLTSGVTLTRASGTSTFAVQALEAVQASSSAAWCTVSATEPTVAMKVVTVTVNVEENTDVNDRTAVVTLTSGGQTQTVNVTQLATDGLLMTESSYEVGADGDVLNITLTTNGTPEITCNNKWITQTPTKANMGDAVYSFNIGINYAATDRTGTITFTLGTLSETVTVVQAGREYTDAGMNSDAVTLAQKMVAGINIGNTLEATGGETAWGNPMVNKDYIDGLKDAGFNAVRIPCAWDSYIIDQETYEIDPTWLDRVSEVVGYCRDNEMYAILNIHWDGGWLEDHILNGYNEAIDNKQRALWTQIANKLNVYDEYLLFAGCNEIGMNETSSGEHPFEADDYETIRKYEQTFIDAVRATGGNNATRCLVVQAPATRIDDAEKQADIWMPTDKVADRLFVEVHFYEPYQFCLMESDANWSKTFWYWGAQNYVEGSEHNPTENGDADFVIKRFEQIKGRFADNGIPTILGEYDAMARTVSENQAAHDASRVYWNEVVTREAKNHGLVPFHWETGSEINRNNGSVTATNVINGIIAGAEAGTYPF